MTLETCQYLFCLPEMSCASAIKLRQQESTNRIGCGKRFPLLPMPFLRRISLLRISPLRSETIVACVSHRTDMKLSSCGRGNGPQRGSRSGRNTRRIKQNPTPFRSRVKHKNRLMHRLPPLMNRNAIVSLRFHIKRPFGSQRIKRLLSTILVSIFGFAVHPSTRSRKQPCTSIITRQ